MSYAAHLHFERSQFEVDARPFRGLVHLLAHFDLAQGHASQIPESPDTWPKDLHSGDRNLADALDQGTCDGLVTALCLPFVASTDELVEVGKLLIVLFL